MRSIRKSSIRKIGLLAAGLGVGLLTAAGRTAGAETLAATFTQPDGGVTVSSYEGLVQLDVTGVGQSYGGEYNDAFYLYTGSFDPPQNGHDGGYYQLSFGTSPLMPFSLANNARNFLVDPLPAYNPAHEYTFILDTGLLSPGQLHFGVSDGGYGDNTGAYTITVTQLGADIPDAPSVPEPGTLALLGAGALPLFRARRRLR